MAGDLPKPSVAWALFSFKGRIARQSYILGQLLMMSIFAVIIARIVAAGEDQNLLAIWGLIMFAFFGFALWGSLALTVKRLHDLGQPGALAVVMFIPTVNFIAAVILMILPSSPNTNEHGPPPFGPPSAPPSQ